MIITYIFAKFAFIFVPAAWQRLSFLVKNYRILKICYVILFL